MSANPWAAQFAQLAKQSSRPALTARTYYNPRPAGVIRNGSATHALLDLFKAHPNRYFTHAEILWRTKCSKRAIDWALIYLKSQQLIKCVSDDGRNLRYFRYKLS